MMNANIKAVQRLIDKLSPVCGPERTDVVMAALASMLEQTMRNVCAVSGRNYEEWVREFAATMLIDANAPKDPDGN